MFAFLTGVLFAHKGNVHQYLVSQGYQLFKSTNSSISQIENNFNTILAGAIEEDENDPVFHYKDFLVGDNAIISISHFWDADDGNFNDNTFRVAWQNFAGTIGPYHNAYLKARLYADGGWTYTFNHTPWLRVQKANGDWLRLVDNTPYPISLSYYSLADLFVNNRMRTELIGTYEMFNENTQRYEWYDGDVYVDDDFKNQVVFEFLGRLCHLLGDMSVPAHAHGDEHGLPPTDEYEDWMGSSTQNYSVFNYQNVGGLRYPTDSDPIHYLMYTTQQRADYYGSNGPYEGDGDAIIGGDYTTEEYFYLFPIFSGEGGDLGGPTGTGGPFNTANKENIRNWTFPQAIKATAGLFYWFATETNLLLKINVKNNFTYGTIKVGTNTTPLEKNSPYTFGATIDQSVSFLTQPQIYQNILRVWNRNGVPSSFSKWQKQVGQNPPVDLANGNDCAYSFTASQGDNNATYIAGMMKNYKINKFYKTEFDGTFTEGLPMYVVQENSGQIFADPIYTPGVVSYNFEGWTDDLTEPINRTIYPNDNKTYTALYKNANYSNNTNSFFKNGRKQFLRTPDGKLHKVYESMGRVWYERSTNNGQSWDVVTSFGYDDMPAQQPYIDYIVHDNIILVAIGYYLDRGQWGTFWRMDVLYSSIESDCFSDVSFIETPLDSPEGDVTVVTDHAFAWNNNYESLFIYKKIFNSTPEQLSYVYGILTPDNGPCGPFQFNVLASGFVNGSSTTAKNISIDVAKNSNKFHLAWEQDNKIEYLEYQYNNGVLQILDQAEYTSSSGTGFTGHTNPSIIALGDNAKLVWRGTRNYYPDGGEAQYYRQNSILYKEPGVEGFGQFGSNASNPYINKSDDGTYFAFAWSENNGAVNKFADNTLNNIWTMPNNIGKDIQLSNGNNKFTMYAETYNNGAIPYYFKTSANLGAMQYNIPSYTDGPATGREGIITSGHAELFFNFGDISIDDRPVEFVPLAEHPQYNSCEDMNQFSITQPFDIYDGVDFTYSILYGIADSTAAVALLTNGNSVSYNLYLIDDATGSILVPLDNIIFDEGNIFQYANIRYQLNTTGLGRRTVRMKLVTSNNFDADYTLNQSLNDGAEALEKMNIIHKNVDLPVTEYNLAQNYPNPFNPTTEIFYQIPQTGQVTLKIYDILGKEIKTLIDEPKNKGRYSVKFDASRLASGIYIYQLKVNDYMNSKKMILLK